jgi:FtsH-binding integral membrane protein
MKTNKKAILGMLVAMIMSLGVMQGISVQKQSEDANLQQAWTVACYTSEAGLADQLMGCVVSYGVAVAFGGPAGLIVAL